MMKVDLRQFPKLLHELAVKALGKTRNLNSKEMEELLDVQYGIKGTIDLGSSLFVINTDEATSTWVALKWR
jgi:hypothetical protein